MIVQWSPRKITVLGKIQGDNWLTRNPKRRSCEEPSYRAANVRAMTGLSVRHRAVLPVTEPYRFELSRRALAGFRPFAGDHQIIDGHIRKALTIPSPPGRSGPPEQAAVVEVGPAPAGVRLTVFAAEPLDAAEVALVERSVSRWLSLGDDLTRFWEIAAGDPAMGRLIDVARGLHQVRFASLAEGVVYFTLAQRSTQWFAAARKRRIAARRGPTVLLDGTAHTGFPSLRALATLTDHELLDYGGNRQRADRLRSVVAGVAALDEEWLRTAPYDEVRRALLAVPGIGNFTAHAVLLRVLGRPDDAPLELAQFTLVARAIYGDPPPAPGEIRERYGPWVGWWAYVARTALDWLRERKAAPLSTRSSRGA